MILLYDQRIENARTNKKCLQCNDNVNTMYVLAMSQQKSPTLLAQDRGQGGILKALNLDKLVFGGRLATNPGEYALGAAHRRRLSCTQAMSIFCREPNHERNASTLV
jgi:hypothetical protein